MTDHHDSATQVLQTYYDILTAGSESTDLTGLRDVLAPDLVFERPIAGHRVGAESFIKGVSGFVATMGSLEMLHQLSAGDMAAALYDAEMPGGPVRFAEFFQLERGKVKSLRLAYDATEYRARGGR